MAKSGFGQITLVCKLCIHIEMSNKELLVEATNN